MTSLNGVHMSTKQSAYHKAMEYLTKEITSMMNEGFLSQEDGINGIEGLKDLSAAEIMEMFKAWKDSEV